MRKWLLFLVVFMIALSACAPAAQPGQGEAISENVLPGSTPEVGEAIPAETAEKPLAVTGDQTVTRAITSEPPALDPQGAAGAGQNAILPYLFDTLVYQDLDNTFKPYLAESWEISPDGMQATFKLRENILFHDGSPLDAEAVKFTFERLIEQGQKSPLASMVTVIDTIEAVDETTVRFNFKEPSSTFLSSVSSTYAGIVSPKAIQADNEGFGKKPVGSGAFILEKWEPGVAITLVKNPQYAWGPAVLDNQAAPNLDRLVFKIIPDIAQQVTAFQAGEVDVLFINQTSHVAKLQQDPNTEMVETTLNSLIYLGFNVKKPPFDDVRVRQAISHAVNKDELVKVALGGIGEPAFAPLAPTLPGFDPSLKSAELGFDLEKSKALFAEAGFSQGGDGVWAKDGQPLTATLLTSTRPPNQALATVLQSQLKAAGVQVEIQQLDSGAAQEAATAGTYDLLLWRYDWNDPDVLRVYLSTSRIGRTNRNFYSNPELDALLDQAAHEMDDAKRSALYLDAQKILLQDAPWQPLYTPKDFIAIRKDVSGVVMGPMGRMLMNEAEKK